ncbi:MAG: CotH kinase family protein [Prevotella sp.]|nr:CotH kinase family protein [Prevotella sp.]
MKLRSLLLMVLMSLLAVHSASAQWDRMTNLPTIYIDTYNGQPITSKTVYVYATLRYIDEQDQMTVYDSLEIRGRGNSTWNMRKKPYKLKFNQKVRFLGPERANAKKWTLLANAGDKSLIRNAVTSAMGEFTSLKFNPGYKFVDLVLNGQYLGNYQISDQIDVRKRRVNVVEQDLPLTDDSDITGGYLLEVDGFQDGNCFTTSNYSVPIRIHYPDEDEIVTSQSRYVRSYMAAFENALRLRAFDDMKTGYRSYVDAPSLIDWFLCTEISANIDGYYSTYFYKDQGDSLLYWGPLWDYDIAYNNDQRITGTVEKLMTDYGYGQTKLWINRMWQDPWFTRTVNERYNELIDNGLVAYLHEKIDSLSDLLQESQSLNYERWGISTKMYHEIVLYSSYDQYVTDLKAFISAHCAWLKGAFEKRQPKNPTPEFETSNYFYRVLNAKSSKAAGVSDTCITQQTNTEENTKEDWWIKKMGDHFIFINRANMLALSDPTEGDVGPTVNIGTRLTTAPEDSLDERQLWDILPQGSSGYYIIRNVYTQHIMNVSNGNTSDGAYIISFTNDSRNTSSTNRLWYFVATREEISEEITGIRDVEPEDYALAYNPTTQELHFGSEQPELLQRFVARVFTADGRAVGSFRADEHFSLQTMPAGIYIVTWQCGGQKRSVKLKR